MRADSATPSRRNWPVPFVIAGLFSFSLAAGSVSQLVHPGRIPWVEPVRTGDVPAGITLVDLAGARNRVEAGTFLIFDARGAADYDRGHLPGALSLPAGGSRESLAEWTGVIRPGEVVMVYCGGRGCEDAVRLAAWLEKVTGAQAEVFPGGFEAWVEAGLPVEGK